MFKATTLSVVLFFLLTFCAWAQEATIIELNGEVSVRADEDSEWQNAILGLLLQANAEIKTGPGSSCTVAFDDQKKNIVKIEENSNLTIENIVPGKVFLPEGRVFSFIKDLKQTEKFEVRTPKAVSGARGTGWLTVVSDGETQFSCFDDQIVVASLNDEGEITSTVELQEGLEVSVENVVQYADIKGIPEEKQKIWNGFVSNVENIKIPKPQELKPGQTTPVPLKLQKNQMLPGTPRPGTQPTSSTLATGQNPNQPPPPGTTVMPPPNGSTTVPAPSGSTTMPPPPNGTMPPPPNGAMPPPPEGTMPPPPEGTMPPPPEGTMPPPPEGEMPPPPEWGSSWESTQWNGDYDPFKDAQQEVNQTLIENNIAACGHHCCPFPQCCDIFEEYSAQKDYCLHH